MCCRVCVHTFIIPFQLSPVDTRNSVRKAIPKFLNVAWRLRPSHGLFSLQSDQQKHISMTSFIHQNKNHWNCPEKPHRLEFMERVWLLLKCWKTISYVTVSLNGRQMEAVCCGKYVLFFSQTDKASVWFHKMVLLYWFVCVRLDCNILGFMDGPFNHTAVKQMWQFFEHFKKKEIHSLVCNCKCPI